MAAAQCTAAWVSTPPMIWTVTRCILGRSDERAAGGGQASDEAVELELLSGHAGRRTLEFINRCGDVRSRRSTGPAKDTPRIPGWSGNLWVRLSPAGATAQSHHWKLLTP